MSYADLKDQGALVESGNFKALSAEPGQSLAKRLIATFFTTAFFLVLAASIILYWGTVRTLQYADDQVVDKRAGTVTDILQAPDLNDGLLAHEVNEDNQGPRQIFIRVISEFEPIHVETTGMSELLAPALFPVAESGRGLDSARDTISLPDGRSYRVASYKVPITAKPELAQATLQVATDTTLDQGSIKVFQNILLWVIGAAIPLCALAAWYVVSQSMKPLARITAAAQRIDGSTLDQRIALINLPAELHELAVHFNSMLSRLELTWSDLKHYADTIAHEMRTPLNRMRLECELALNNAGTIGDFREVMGSAVGECERLTRLLQGLLFLARVDSNQASIAPKQIALEPLLSSIGDYFEAETSEAGISLGVNCDPDLEIVADRDLLQQAVTNLISNAISHTPRGGSIIVRAKSNGNQAALSVEDTGVGIEAEDQSRIFDRFCRATNPAPIDNSATRLGLGLSIVKGIAELHGGRVSLESTKGKGTKVTMYLPAMSHRATQFELGYAPGGNTVSLRSTQHS